MNAVPARFLLENVGAGAVAPALATAAALWAATRLRERPSARGAVAALALPAGFLAGYLLLPWAPIRPEQPWHWLPELAAGVGVAGAVGSLAGPRWPIRLVATVLASALAAWLVVPDWSDWRDDRAAAIVALAIGLAVLTVAFRPVAVRMPGVLLPVLLGVATVVGALILGLSQNLKFAQLAGMAAASLGGWALVAWRDASVSMADAMLSWVGLTGGLMFLGWAYSFSAVPAASYALVPCAPLSLWLCELALPAAWQGARRGAIQALCVAVPLAVALGLAVAADLAAGG